VSQVDRDSDTKGYGASLDDALGARHMPVLDGLRAIAALLVVLYHFDERRFLPAGGFGVLVFFVLSGFLITWLLCAEVERTGKVSLRRFYARRSLRIFPAFYVYWAITTAMLLVLQARTGKPVPWAQAASSFFYVCNYYQGLHHYPPSGYSHTWSLGVEEQFYLVWPALFIALARTAGRQRVLWVLSIIAASWAARLTLFFVGAPEEYLYTAFEARCDQLMLGCLVAVTLRAGLARGLVRALTSTPALLVLTLGALGASRAAESHFGPNYRNSIGFCVEPGLVALLIVQLFGSHKHVVVRWLDSRPMKVLGAMSYSIYLYQQLVLHFAPRFVPASAPMLIRLPITVAAVIAVAWLSYRFIETPLNKYKARFAA
jgi:peptidoglycan/LPS O-acetylase OafA/YrhL